MLHAASGNESYGVDGHPFIARIAKAKNLWHLDHYDYLEACNEVINTSNKIKAVTSRYDESNLLGKCYDFETLTALDNIKKAYENLSDGNPIWELVRLNITSILRVCSKVGTAQWQYILPSKAKSKVLNAKNAFLDKADLMAADMEYAKCFSLEKYGSHLQA